MRTAEPAMADIQWPDEREWAFRVERYEQLRDQFAAESQTTYEQVTAERAAARGELEEIIGRFRADRDADAFKEAVDAWSRGKPFFGFAGPNGAMFVNQLVKDSTAERARYFLDRALSVPANDAEAEAAMDELTEHVVHLREQGSSAAVGRVASFFSWFWWFADPETWTHNWTSARKALKALGFLVEEGTQWEQYRLFREHIVRFGQPDEVGQLLQLLDSSGKYGLDRTAGARLERVGEAPREADGPGFEASKRTIETMRWMMRSLRDELTPVASELLDRKVKGFVSPDWWNEGRLREDFHVSWRPDVDHRVPQVMLIVGQGRVQIGLYGSSHQNDGRGFSQLFVEALKGNEPEGLQWCQWGWSANESDDPSDRTSSALLGRQYAISDVDTHAKLMAEFRRVTAASKPCFEIVRSADLGSSPREPHLATGTEPIEPDTADLGALFQAFLQETEYPTETDAGERAQQRRWESMLQPESLSSIPMSELRRIYSGGTYGNPGPQSILHSTLAGDPPDVVDRFLNAIGYLLWADQPVANRIDRVMDEDDLGLRGFKESGIMKLLAVGRPAEFLAVYPFTGDKGKARAMAVLGLTPPPMSASVGQRNADSTAQLKRVLEPLLPGDSWGQSRFLYWLMDRERTDEATIDAEPEAIDRVGMAADELSLPRHFLDEIADLLEAERQLIFYGPPGTGKTYVAQHLAEAIAPNPDHRMLVQFHPSTSYEDFFEGYRPVPGRDDQITYRLMPGPLRSLAEHAASHPGGAPHVLIIDEINRANIAKVLGELLYLLEYRDREIRPLYRPDEPFTLPTNLWIIATMNTADRSIATVDAALRRRFHFIPFVPDDREDNPISGLLGRWLEDKQEPTWLADLVDGVNQKLRKELGGDHLLLGPSYFMKKGVDRSELERIWRYRIEPLIDDIFFGDERARAFRFDSIWREFAPVDDGAA